MRTDRVGGQIERVVGWERQPRVLGREEGKQQVPSSSGAPGWQGRAHAESGQELALTSMVLSSDPTLLRAPASLRPQARSPASEQQPPSPPGWAPELGTRSGPLPGIDTPIPFPPLRGGVMGGGEVEKEE